MADFRWTENAHTVALALAEGQTRAEAAALASVGETTVYRWLREPAFAEEVDRLTLAVGIAARAERMRIAMRVARQKVKDNGTVETKADLLDWLKFAQSETTGAVADFTEALADALAARMPTPTKD